MCEHDSTFIISRFFSSKSPREWSVHYMQELHLHWTRFLRRPETGGSRETSRPPFRVTQPAICTSATVLHEQTTQGEDFSEMELSMVDYIAVLHNSLRFANVRHAANALTYCAIAAALARIFISYSFLLFIYFYYTSFKTIFQSCPHKGVHVPIKEQICETHVRVATPLPLHYRYYYSLLFYLFFSFLSSILFNV